MVARYEYALTFTDMYPLITIVENHLAGVYIIDCVFLWTVNASAQIIVDEAVEHIIVVEDQFHRALIVVSVGCHSFLYLFSTAKVANKYERIVQLLFSG